jgi:hypothetical protein
MFPGFVGYAITAVVDSRDRGPRGDELTENEYTSEVTHRHAHTFYEQSRGTVFRYRCSNRRTRVELDPGQS